MLSIDFDPPKAHLRQFGWIALAGFPFAGLMLTEVVLDLPAWVLWAGCALGLAMGVCAAANMVAAIKPVYVGMMLIALPIGFVLSYVLLALIYYGMFTLVATLFRLAGRDVLHRKPDRAARSYWVHRDTPRAPASYLRLY